MRAGAGRLSEAFDAVSGLATGHGGFVSDSDLSPDGSGPSARLVLRVPNDQVDAVLGSLGQVGTVTQEQVQGEDVTGQVINLDAQISTLDAEANAVRTLLARATSIGDILTIQNQLFDLQTQIQQLTGQQSSLADKTTYATISVELTAPVVATAAPKPPAHQSAIARAWTLAGHNIVAVLRALGLIVGWAAPALVVAGGVGVGFLLWRRRRRAGPA